MMLNIFTDGGAKGNPGPSAIGVVVYDAGNKELVRYREDIGIATNNIAEYTAVLRALDIVKNKKNSAEWQVDSITFYSDSKLLVEQLNGNYKVKNDTLKHLYQSVRDLEREIGISAAFVHVPREKNITADALVNNKLSSTL